MNLHRDKSGTRAWAHGLVDVETGTACDFPPPAGDALTHTLLTVCSFASVPLAPPWSIAQAVIAVALLGLSFLSVRSWREYLTERTAHRAAVRRVADAWARHDADARANASPAPAPADG